jgi:hypothetical protein
MATTKKKSSLAKAQATRTEKVATGTGGVKPARVPLPTFTAPADFAPHFLEVVVTTEEDGLLASQIEATREFGEVCTPINYDDPWKSGTVSRDDSDLWKPLPMAPEEE